MIDQHQNQLGVIPVDQALSLAREAGLDLVEVSPTENPPVCRIMDYGKHQYEKKKRAKMAAAAHQVELKEIRLRPKTDPHDRQIKMRNAQKFLEEGNKVQFTMLFRGRERFNKEFAAGIFNEIIQEMGESVKIERPPLFEGRRMVMIVAPAKTGSKPKPSSGQAGGNTKAAPKKPAPTKQDAPEQNAQKVESAASPQSPGEAEAERAGQSSGTQG